MQTDKPTDWKRSDALLDECRQTVAKFDAAKAKQLPPLPEPHVLDGHWRDHSHKVTGFTAKQMQEYARAAMRPLETCQCPACRPTVHASDCAVHNEPAMPRGPCDCGVASSLPPPGGEPTAWMWQHEETGATGFVQHASPDELRQWERMNRPRKIVTPLYASPLPAHQVGGEDAKDAARYRWLRDKAEGKPDIAEFWPAVRLDLTWPQEQQWVSLGDDGCTLDEAIDSAMLASPTPASGATGAGGGRDTASGVPGTSNDQQEQPR
jgi:hypothetical protein